jgi:uncharacterized protein (TIGR02996 family)
VESATAFLPAILADPDDDTPRLVCADWFEERGDPRGEFIRIQCRLATLTEDAADWPALKSREFALRSQHEKEWAAPLRGLVRAWEFRRGFVEEVVMEAAAFLRQAAVLFAAAPIRSVRFLDAGQLVPELVACPAFGRLAAVLFNANYLTNEAVRHLAASPFARQLNHLHLGGNSISDDGAAALAAAPLDRLEVLVLANNGVGPDGGEALARARHFVRLTSLDLYRNFIGDRGAAAFLASELPALTALRTSFNGIGPEFQAALREKYPRPFPLAPA